MSVTMVSIGLVICLIVLAKLFLTTPAERRHEMVDIEVGTILKNIEEWYPGFMMDDPDYPPRYIEGKDRTIVIPRADIQAFTYWLYARARIKLAESEGVYKELGYEYTLNHKRCRIPIVIKD